MNSSKIRLKSLGNVRPVDSKILKKTIKSSSIIEQNQSKQPTVSEKVPISSKRKLDDTKNTTGSDKNDRIVSKASDIDDLFSSLKQSKLQKLESEKIKAKEVKQQEAMKIKAKKDNDASMKRSKITNPEAPIERIDPESGYPVYKAHLLRVGEGGGTPLCPFDCNCCF